MQRRDWDQAVVQLGPKVVVQSIGGEGLLLNLRDETVFSLNESGARIVEQLAIPRRVPEIVGTLVAATGMAPDQIERDVTTLLGLLLSHGLIVVGRPEVER